MNENETKDIIANIINMAIAIRTETKIKEINETIKNINDMIEHIDIDDLDIISK